MGDRRSELVKMDTKSGASDYVHMEFTIPSRGLIGLRRPHADRHAGPGDHAPHLLAVRADARLDPRSGRPA